MLSKTLIRLFKTLAELYPDTASSTLLMDAAGIRLDRIFSEQGAGTRFYFVVREAEKAGQIPALLAAAMADYPEHTELLGIRAELGLSASAARRLTVLAIWPSVLGQPPLDTSGDAAALYGSGIDYIALQGALATRDSVTREWGRVKPQMLVVGGHGEDGQIYLSDGLSSVGWWTRAMRIHTPQLVLLMSCESSSSAHLDIPDAFIRSGAKDVIAIDAKILDTDAVLFLHVFFERLTQPMSVKDAYDIARLSLPDAGAAMMRHREGKEEMS